MKTFPKKRKNEDLIIGVQAIKTALAENKTFNKVFVQKGEREMGIELLLKVLRKVKTTIQYVPKEKLDRLTNRNHQGIAALLSPVAYADINVVLANVYETGDLPIVALLDGITDVGNFGAIARSALALGVHALVIPAKSGVSITADALKTSSGALLDIPVCRVGNLAETAQLLKSSGLRMIGATEKGSLPIKLIPQDIPIGLVLGAEDTGISEEMLDLIDDEVVIPMFKKTTGSLNVAAAAAICFYELGTRNF